MPRTRLQSTGSQSGPPAAPLYRRIETTIRTQIAEGVWNPGDPLPSRRELCRQFRTTRVTLDKAINGLMAQGLLKAAQGSGTFVAGETPAAGEFQIPRRRAPGGRRLRIGIVTGTSTPSGDEQETETNLYMAQLLAGIHNFSGGNNVDTTFAHIDMFQHTDGDRYLAYFRESELDGMIVIAPTVGDLKAVRDLFAADVPFVVLSNSPDRAGDEALPWVRIDNKEAGALAVNHLIGLGHTDIGMVNLALDHGDHLERMDGFLRAMAANRIPVNPANLVLNPWYMLEEFEQIVDGWLGKAIDADRLPTALFVCDYYMTLAVLSVLRKRKIRVPEEISIVGFDDLPAAEFSIPPLTTIRQPVFQVGRQAMRRLLSSFATEGELHMLRGSQFLRAELIVRESTASPRVRTSLLATKNAERTSEQ